MPMNTTRCMPAMSCSVRFSSGRRTVPSSKDTRPRRVLITDSGWSCISLCMKCWNLPFSADCASKGIRVTFFSMGEPSIEENVVSSEPMEAISPPDR